MKSHQIYRCNNLILFASFIILAAPLSSSNIHLHCPFLLFLYVQASILNHFNTYHFHLFLLNFKTKYNLSLSWSLKFHIFNHHFLSSTQASTMRPKTHQTLNFKFLIVAVLVAFFLLFMLRSSFSISNQYMSPNYSQSQSSKASASADDKGSSSTKDCSSLSCSKIPPSLSQALIHYSTSTITPQQTHKEISVSARVLEKKSPCNFLVFGLGHDSLMWSALNHGGRTVFLEEDESWIEQIRRRFPTLESYHVTYDSKVNMADSLMEVGKGPECTAVGDPRYSMCQLALKGLPDFVYETKWDLIMVDAPTGYYDEAPGRMTAIYTAGMMARNREGGAKTDVFVHDVNRVVEDKFSKAFLCEKYMKQQEGRLRHFRIPSHRDDLDRPFCPDE